MTKNEVIKNLSEDNNIMSVGAFLDMVNEILGENFRGVFIQGEISGLSEHPSGVYFALKDAEDEGILNCYLPPGIYHSLGFGLEDGMMVKVTGNPNIWKPKGRFSFVVSSLELVGEGTLKKAYELLKKKLEAEGLFARKRELPEFISSIGVVTSRTGAVINDFRTNLARLGFKVFVHDSRVEGERAVSEVKQAVSWFNKNKADLDVLVVMRGGGSLEDLQAFNNELVAREVFASNIPVIAAIGHDRDVPIASLAADQAVSTPTAAANLINESWSRLIMDLPQNEQALLNLYESILRDVINKVNYSAQRLENAWQMVVGKYQDVINAFLNGVNMIGEKISNLKEQVSAHEKFLVNASPGRQLKLGYSIVRNKQGKVIKNVEDLKTEEEVETKLGKGKFISKVKKIFK